jgi:hypothetical protein
MMNASRPTAATTQRTTSQRTKRRKSYRLQQNKLVFDLPLDLFNLLFPFLQLELLYNAPCIWWYRRARAFIRKQQMRMLSILHVTKGGATCKDVFPQEYLYEKHHPSKLYELRQPLWYTKISPLCMSSLNLINYLQALRRVAAFMQVLKDDDDMGPDLSRFTEEEKKQISHYNNDQKPSLLAHLVSAYSGHLAHASFLHENVMLTLTSSATHLYRNVLLTANNTTIPHLLHSNLDRQEEDDQRLHETAETISVLLRLLYVYTGMASYVILWKNLPHAHAELIILVTAFSSRFFIRELNTPDGAFYLGHVDEYEVYWHDKGIKEVLLPAFVHHDSSASSNNRVMLLTWPEYFSWWPRLIDRPVRVCCSAPPYCSRCNHAEFPTGTNLNWSLANGIICEPRAVSVQQELERVLNTEKERKRISRYVPFAFAMQALHHYLRVIYMEPVNMNSQLF